MRRQQYGHPDKNQGAIVKALRAVGAWVVITTAIGGGFVDLVVGFRGRTFLLEVKDPTGRHVTKFEREHNRLNETEADFHRDWPGGALHVVTSPEEALEAIGVRRSGSAAALERVLSLPEPKSGILAVPTHTADECDDPTCRMHWRGP